MWPIPINPLVIKANEIGVGFAVAARMQSYITAGRIRSCVIRHKQNNASPRHRSVPFRPRRRHKQEYIGARGRMAVGGGPGHAPVVVGTPGTPLFHRVESPTQDRAVAALQTRSFEMWGRPAQGSSLPSVKAYRNALPQTRRGVEFCTGSSPTPGSGTPYEARWYLGSPGVFAPAAAPRGNAFAAISINYIKNTQVP